MIKNTTIPFTNIEHARLLGSTYKFVEIIATGEHVEVGPDEWKREILLRAYRAMPVYHNVAEHYIMPVGDLELKELADGEHNYVVRLERVL